MLPREKEGCSLQVVQQYPGYTFPTCCFILCWSEAQLSQNRKWAFGQLVFWGLLATNWWIRVGHCLLCPPENLVLFNLLLTKEEDCRPLILSKYLNSRTLKGNSFACLTNCICVSLIIYLLWCHWTLNSKIGPGQHPFATDCIHPSCINRWHLR